MIDRSLLEILLPAEVSLLASGSVWSHVCVEAAEKGVQRSRTHNLQNDFDGYLKFLKISLFVILMGLFWFRSSIS